MTTSAMYEILWCDEKTSDYVMAIAPCAVLPYITVDPGESCYIIHVNKNTGSAAVRAENGEKTVNVNINSPLLAFGRVGHDPDGLVGGHWL